MSFLENIQDVYENHTVIGRMENDGDSLIEAMRNDWSEDTVTGRMQTQGEGFIEATANAAENKTLFEIANRCLMPFNPLMF